MVNKENEFPKNLEKSKTIKVNKKNESSNENVLIPKFFENQDNQKDPNIEDLNNSDSLARNDEDNSLENVRSKWDENIYKNIEVPFPEK